MPSEYAIRTEGLSKCFKLYARPIDRIKQLLFARMTQRMFCTEFWALQGISVKIRKGESFGIIGANGSGKSTFLQLLCGTMTSTSGSLHVNGRIVGLLELGSGFNPELSGRENVFVNAAVLGLTTAQIEECFDRIVDFAGIGEFIDRPLKTYSSGMGLRLAFAVMAHVDADILVIDEAFAVGDAAFSQKCMRFLQKFRENGTLILVSHDIASVTNLCRRVLWIEGGKAHMLGEAKQVCESYTATIYGATTCESTHRQADANGESGQGFQNNFTEGTGLNEISVLNSSSRSDVGTGGAEILQIRIGDEHGNPLSRIFGGQSVRLTVEAVARSQINRPVLSFALKDRLGQTLFAETTLSVKQQEVKNIKTGDRIAGLFEFVMPRLPYGHHFIDGGLAEFDNEQPVILVWARDMLALRCDNNDVKIGLIGVALNKVEIEHQRCPMESERV